MNNERYIQQYSISIALTTKDREWVRCNALTNYDRDMDEMDEYFSNNIGKPGIILCVISHEGEILRFRAELIAYYSLAEWKDTD